MTTIYRVQDADGRGPWKPGFSHKWTEAKPISEYSQLRPIQEEFPTLDYRKLKHAGVGCRTLKQLRRWISETEYAALQHYGYQCVRLEGKIVAESKVQLVFERDKPLSEGTRPARLYT